MARRKRTLVAKTEVAQDLELVLSYIEHFKYLEKNRIEKLRRYISTAAAIEFSESYEHADVLGGCPNGCARFSEYDKNIGMEYCPMCGEDIVWRESNG